MAAETKEVQTSQAEPEEQKVAKGQTLRRK